MGAVLETRPEAVLAVATGLIANVDSPPCTSDSDRAVGGSSQPRFELATDVDSPGTTRVSLHVWPSWQLRDAGNSRAVVEGFFSERDRRLGVDQRDANGDASP